MRERNKNDHSGDDMQDGVEWKDPSDDDWDDDDDWNDDDWNETETDDWDEDDNWDEVDDWDEEIESIRSFCDSFLRQ